MLAVERSGAGSDDDEEDREDLAIAESLKASVSRTLLLQARAYQWRRKKNPLIELQLNWDSPDWVVNFDPENDGVPAPVGEELAVSELLRSWEVCRGPRDVARHLCLVAAGMASRPRRPDRPVTFRPFSSRDAHIMLQLKRTLDSLAHVQHRPSGGEGEGAAGRSRRSSSRNNNNNSNNSACCSTLLRHAQQAGKAARNPDKVPELLELRRYGTGDNSKYATEPPAQLARQVREVRKEAVSLQLRRPPRAY
jgi:hypothetical protein